MVDSLWRLWLLLPPVLTAGILHMVIVTHNIGSRWAIPLHEKWFGRNKTWRGLIVVPLLSTLAAPLFLGFLGNITLILLTGFATGLGYMLMELPNSALKRSLGIPPGRLPTHAKVLFIFLDQADSATGIAIGCMLVLPLSLWQGLMLAGLFIISAVIIKNALYLLSLKQSRF